MNLKTIKLSEIVTNPNQPRKHFDEQSLQELAESIKKDGLQEAILVRPKGDKFEIVQGERRYRAHKLAGLESIHAKVREVDDEDAFHLAVIENIQREQLTAIEEARAFLWYSHKGLTQDEIAEKVKKSRDYVASKLRLLNLSETVQSMIERGEIKEGHAKQLLRLKGILERLCTEDFAPVKPNMSLFELFQEKFTRHFWDKMPITVKDVKDWVEEWYYLLVFSAVRQSVGYYSAVICKKSNESSLPMDLTIDNICYLYGVDIKNISENDIDFAISFEEDLLKHSYDKEFRKWNIEKFYDSIKFKENPISKKPIQQIKPIHYRFLMFLDGVENNQKDDEGFVIISDDEELYSSLISRYNDDGSFRKEYGILLLNLVLNHSTLDLTAEQVKEFYSFDNYMSENGFEDVYEALSNDNGSVNQGILNVRLLIEQTNRICEEEGMPHMNSDELARMLVINFREETGENVDLDVAVDTVNAALALEISQTEIDRLLDEADEEIVSRDTIEN